MQDCQLTLISIIKTQTELAIWHCLLYKLYDIGVTSMYDLCNKTMKQ